MFLKFFNGIYNFWRNFFSSFFKTVNTPASDQAAYERHLAQLKQVMADTDAKLLQKKSAHVYSIPRVWNHNLAYPVEGVGILLNDYDKQPFYERWWLRLSGSHKCNRNDYRRLWLAAEVCKPFLDCKSLGDSNFSIPETYLRVFPKNLRKILAKLVADVFNWRQQNGTLTQTQYSDTLKQYRILNKSEIPQQNLLLTTGSTKISSTNQGPLSQALIISRLEEYTIQQQEARYKEAVLICACGFFNLDYKTTTNRQILKKLRTLYLKIHPDKIVTGFNNDAGEWEDYCERVTGSLTYGMKLMFAAISTIFSGIQSNDNKVFSGRFSDMEVRGDLEEGIRTRKTFGKLYEKVMVTFPTKNTASYKLKQARKKAKESLASSEPVTIIPKLDPVETQEVKEAVTTTDQNSSAVTSPRP
jgi:hypothetical protein